MKKLTIIDGYSFLFRAYYATLKNNNLYNKNGVPINAVYTFAKMINKIIANLEKNECIFVGFDSIKPSFRKSSFVEYKANRSPCPENLKIQMPIAHEFLEALSVFNYEVDHFEGDDICGSVAKLASKDNYDVTIYTSDHDFFQLIDDNIKIKLVKTGLNNVEEINKENLYSLYGFNAEQLIDFKGLIGDQSDNLPGIPGIGTKTALKLLSKYHSFEEIIFQAKNNNLEIKNKLVDNLIKYQKQGEISKSLATIKTDITFPFLIKKLEYQGFSIKKIKNFCEKYELKELLINLPKKFMKIENNIIKTNDLPNKTFKTISLFLDTKDNQIDNIIVSDNKKETYVINRVNFKDNSNLFKILKNENIKKYVFNYKETKNKLKEINVDLFGFDFCLLSAIKLIDDSLKDFISIANYFHIDLKDHHIFEYPYYIFELRSKIILELKKNKIYTFFTKTEIPFQKIILNKNHLLSKLTEEKTKKLIEIQEKNQNTILYFIIEHLIKNDNQCYKNFHLVDTKYSQLSNKDLIFIKKVLNLNDFCLISFRYSQIELQTVAVLSKTKKIISQYDIYEKIAQKIIPEKTTNNIEKIVKLGILLGDKSKIIQETNINEEKTNELIKQFYVIYPEIKLYFKNLIVDFSKKKHVKNFFNRICCRDKSDIFNSNIINILIKETIIDIMKTTIVKINKKILEKEKFQSELLLQINNNLIFKIKKNQKEQLIDRIKNIMENVISPMKLKILITEIF